MAQPLGTGLRAARPGGLTSPDPVRTPDARQGSPTQTRPRPRNYGQAAEHASGSKTRPKMARGGERPETPHSAFNRWIEA
jgi:hypothetical protein